MLTGQTRLIARDKRNWVRDSVRRDLRVSVNNRGFCCSLFAYIGSPCSGWSILLLTEPIFLSLWVSHLEVIKVVCSMHIGWLVSVVYASAVTKVGEGRETARRLGRKQRLRRSVVVPTKPPCYAGCVSQLQRRLLRLRKEIPYWWCKICPGIRSEALIRRRTSYIVLAMVYEWQTKDKRSRRSNVNAMNL